MTALRVWLLPATVFLVMVGYLPGVMSVSTAGRWAIILIVGLPSLLVLGLPRWSLVLFSWVVASFFFWSASPLDTAGSMLQWAALIGLGVLASRAENRDRVWIAATIGLSVSLPFVVAQSLGYSPVWAVANSAGTPGTAGLFLTTNVLAEVSAVAYVLMVIKGRYWLALVPAVCMLFAGRYEVYLMLAVAGFIWLPTRRFVVALLFIASLVMIVATWWGYQPLPASMPVRLMIWETTAQHLTFLGHGLGTFGTLFPVFGFAHNDPLQLAFELGVGSVLILGVFAYAFRSGDVAAKSALAALVASSLVWAPLQDPATALLVSVLVGGLCGDVWRASFEGTLRRIVDAHCSAQFQAKSAGALRRFDEGFVDLAARPQPSRGAGSLAADVQRTQG